MDERSWDFATKWLAWSLGITVLFAVVGMSVRLPLPSPGWCFLLGAINGLIIVGPVVYVTLMDT